jgi:hypothetical protein
MKAGELVSETWDKSDKLDVCSNIKPGEKRNTILVEVKNLKQQGKIKSKKVSSSITLFEVAEIEKALFENKN